MVDANITDVSPATAGRFAEETDEVLLLYMAERGRAPADARDAWEEFYRRHAKYVLMICERACNRTLPEEALSEVVVDTFRKVYDSAATYKFSDLEKAEDIRRRARAWLGVIAKHATIDLLRGRREDGAIHIDAEEWSYVEGRPRNKLSVDTVTVRRLMDEILDERERAVLWATYLHYDPDSDHQRLSDDVVSDLCAHFGTTPANLRRIRKNATDKVKNALEAAGYRNHKTAERRAGL